MALTKIKTRFSTVAGLAALGFLAALFCTSLVTPAVWFFIIYGGILVSLVTAVWCWRVERRRDRQASSLGLCIAIAVVILFLLLCIVLPSLG
jgi:hypothetical protein